MGKHNGVGTVYRAGRSVGADAPGAQALPRLDQRKHVRIALRTGSEAEARAKAPAVGCWIGRLLGNARFWRQTRARRNGYAAAIKIAEARGFNYRPITAIAAGEYAELLERVKALGTGGRVLPDPEIKAVLGGVDVPRPRLSTTLADFFELTRDRLKGKSPDQAKRWQDVRRKTVANMIEVFGDKPLPEITRTDAVALSVIGGRTASRQATPLTRRTSSSGRRPTSSTP